MSGVGIIVRYAVQESLRRKVFLVVLILTALFLALYAYGAWLAFDDVADFSARDDPVEAKVLTGSTIFGLAMFSILFLGAVLAVFLTLSSVRGDAERGLLQPLVVRPLGRTQLLAGRFAAAAVVCAGYVMAVYLLAMLITGAVGGWWPDRVFGPGVALAAAVCVIAAVTLLGSVYLSPRPTGSRCSWSSGRAWQPVCWARSARPSTRTAWSASPTWPAGCFRSRPCTSRASTA